MFTLVDYVCLSQEYIRGRFVWKQWQFLIGRAASVQIPAFIRPRIIVQFNLVSGQAFYLNIDSFQIVFMFSAIVYNQNFPLPNRFIASRSNFS